MALWLPAVVIATVTTRYRHLAPNVWELQARPGLDESWRAALAMATHHHLRFGHDFVFTYGPLGFLEQGGLYFTGTAILSSLFNGAMHLALCVTLLWCLRRSFSPAIALLVTLLTAELVRYVGLAETIVLPVAMLGTAVIEQDAPDLLQRWFVPAAGLVAGVAILIKFDAGALALMAGVVVAWFAMPGRVRSELLLAAGFIPTLVLGWLATGNRIGDLPAFFSSSFQITVGYSSGMIYESGKLYQYALVPLAVAILAFTAWRVIPRVGRARRVGLTVLATTVVYGFFKHSFVRHDGASAVEFFVACLVLSCAPRVQPNLQNAGLVGIGVLFLIALSVAWSQRPLLDADPAWTLHTAARQVADLVVASRRQAVVASSRARLRDAYRLDPQTLEALGGATVHVDPWETEVVWAYPQLHWRPLPVFQSYAAYTHALDQENAARLAASDGPDRILRSGTWLAHAESLSDTGALDGRNPDFESPEASLAMLCHYAQVSATDRWQVLARVPNRCGPASRIGAVRAAFGATVLVPRADTSSIVIGRIEGVYGSSIQRLQTALFRSDVYKIELDGAEFRLVPETTTGPLIMSTPPTLGYSPSFGFHTTVRSFRIVEQGHQLGRPSSFTVEFLRVPLAPARAAAGTRVSRAG